MPGCPILRPPGSLRVTHVLLTDEGWESLMLNQASFQPKQWQVEPYTFPPFVRQRHMGNPQCTVADEGWGTRTVVAGTEG